MPNSTAQVVEKKQQTDNDDKNANNLPKDESATKDVILFRAFSLFADKGFNGVSMRDLAKAVKITPAALYYHFPNKKSLFQETIKYAYAFRDRPAVAALEKTDESPTEPDKILERAIHRLCERFYLDDEFRRLVQWTLLYCGSDIDIREIVIKVVYESHFDKLVNFLEENYPGVNGYKLTVFIFGMVMQNYFTLEVRKDHHGYDEKEEAPEVLTREILTVLDKGMLALRAEPK